MLERVIFAGFGGQGVMTVGKLAAAVAMRENREVTLIASYGAEVRGGTANCFLTVADEPIHSPIIEEADTLIILNQPSYDRFRPVLRGGGLLLLNSSIARTDPAMERNGVTLMNIPATETANELGNVRVANIVALGAYCERRGLFAPENVLAELAKELSARPHLLEINQLAFRKGRELARRG